MIEAWGPACAFFSSVTWACGAGGYSKLARENSAFAVNIARATVSLPLFLAAVFLTTGSWQAGLALFGAVHSQHVVWLFLSMIGSYAFGDIMFLLATREIGLSVSLTIASCYPLAMAFWGFAFQGEKLSHAQIFGLLLTVGGMIAAILHAPGAEIQGRAETRSRGLVFAVIAAACWGLNSLAVANGGHNISMAVANSIRMVIALILCAIFGKVLSPRLFPQPNGTKLLLSRVDFKKWLWLFGLEGFGGSCFFMYGLSHTSLAVGSALSSVAPVLSVPVAWALRLEKFSLARTLGVLSVAIGLTLLIAG